MKKITIVLCSLFFLPLAAQEHFSGITTSKRVGILNGSINPSEFSNLNSRFEIQLLATSFNISNNKVGFDDIVNGNNLEELMFEGDESVDFNVDAELIGPGFAMRWTKWGFALTSKAHVQANIVNVDTNLGDAITNSALNSLLGGPTTISSSENQRINGTVWGEIGFSAARNIFENEKHRINGGITLKLLFPGTFANFGAGQFEGTITNTAGDIRLNNASANLNIAYSGALADNFTDSSEYFGSLFGNLKGMATDIGFDYQWKDNKTKKGYKLKVGAAIKNMGSMTFNNENSASKKYNLTVNDVPGGGLDLTQFEDIDNLSDIEQILLDNNGQNGVSFVLEDEHQDFKVKLPTIFNMYADFKIIHKLSLTLFLQQKMGDNNDNDQITSQNSFSLIPRVNVGAFEVYTPVLFNEVSGTTSGLGFRLGGFFLGSNSILTALLSDSKQADFYTGFRFGFL